MEEDSTYNGYTNYETWVAHLWLTNDEPTYRTCQVHAIASRESAPLCNQVSQNIWTMEEAARFLLADRLKRHVEEHSPLNDTATLYSDLLNAAISEIDWHEIADTFLEQ